MIPRGSVLFFDERRRQVRSEFANRQENFAASSRRMPIRESLRAGQTADGQYAQMGIGRLC